MATTIIALFNHKGGVSKTTTAFNLGWALAERNHTVLLVDADPQCNLTGMTLTLSGQDDLETFYRDRPDSNIFAAIQPAFAGAPEKLKPATPVVTAKDNLILLAGHVEFAMYEPELSMAHKLAEAMPVLQNLPGALGYLIRQTADAYGADYTIIDMSPSIGAINQNLLLLSDYFIVPTSPDYFCYMAIDSLARFLPQWNAQGAQLRRLNSQLAYKMPERSPTFLGIISQRYRPRLGRPSAAFQDRIDAIVSRVQTTLVPALQQNGMTITPAQFAAALPNRSPYELAQIADFNALIVHSQEHATPIFALSDEQLGGAVGVVLQQKRDSRDSFRATFSALARAIETLAVSRE